MDSALTYSQDDITTVPKAVSLAALLKQSVEQIRRGQMVEALALLSLARRQITAKQTHYITLLDTLMQKCMESCQARETLLEASKNFARADAELQTLLPLLEQTVMSTTMTPQTQLSPGDEWNAKSPSYHSSMTIVPMRPLESKHLPALYITCFGRFEVQRDQTPVVLCQNRSGQAILRYLLAQSNYRANMDMLMEVLWPDDEPEVARRKLQVAVSALRCSMNAGYGCDSGGGYILYKNRLYSINPAVMLTSDVDEFLQCYEAGRKAQDATKVKYFEQACQLYSGPFLVEDIYADWSFQRREQLSKMYLTMCTSLAEQALTTKNYSDAIRWSTILLEENRCDEVAHRHLMQAYIEQGCRSDALRQFQRCENILRNELGVAPMPETIAIYQSVLVHR